MYEHVKTSCVRCKVGGLGKREKGAVGVLGVSRRGGAITAPRNAVAANHRTMMAVRVSVDPGDHSELAVMGRVVSAAWITALNCAAMTAPYGAPISHPPAG